MKAYYFKTPTKAISKAVQKRLFELGYQWYSKGTKRIYEYDCISINSIADNRMGQSTEDYYQDRRIKKGSLDDLFYTDKYAVKKEFPQGGLTHKMQDEVIAPLHKLKKMFGGKDSEIRGTRVQSVILDELEGRELKTWEKEILNALIKASQEGKKIEIKIKR